MEDLISNLLEIDRAARERVQKAEAQQREITDKIGPEGEAVVEEIRAAARAAVDTMTRNSEGRITASTADIAARFDTAETALRKSYEEKRDALVETIFARCVGDA